MFAKQASMDMVYKNPDLHVSGQFLAKIEKANLSRKL